MEKGWKFTHMRRKKVDDESGRVKRKDCARVQVLKKRT